MTSKELHGGVALPAFEETAECSYHREDDRPARSLTTVALGMPAAEFEAHVATALDTIPPELAALIDNSVVLVQDDPPEDVLPSPLGLSSGTPLTERGQSYAGLPDTVQILRRPILAICDSEED